MKIGIDFDNTIACYDGVFHQAALEKNLIPPSLAKDKTSVRDFLRKEGKEEDWILLQGYVYGTRMDLAQPFPFFEEILLALQQVGHEIYIVSHKTKEPYKGPCHDLHKSAKDWLKKKTFFSSVKKAFFELTLSEKLDRIRLLELDIFIDDLPELLSHKDFPAGVQKILFDPEKKYRDNKRLDAISSWKEIMLLLNP